MPIGVTVGEMMTPNPVCVDGLATVAEALEVMKRHGFSSLVVKRRNEGDEYGIITVTDLAREIIGKNRAPDRVNVYEIMSKPVLSVDRRMDVRYAIQLLVSVGLSRCVVVEGRDMVGIATLRDLTVHYLSHTGRRDRG